MDCYLPADFFLVDDGRRHDDIDPALGADAHVHFESPAFVTGLRDLRESGKPRGPYPGSRRHSRQSANPAFARAAPPRLSRESGNPGAVRCKVPHLGPRFRGDDDAEWRPL